RLPIVLCDLESRSRFEAARQLKIPEGTLSSRLATGRKLLAQRLRRHGVLLSSGGLAAALAPSALASVSPTSISTAVTVAVSVTTGKTMTAGVVSANAKALAQGVMKAMLLTKLKIATAVLFVATTVALVCGVLAGQP